MISQEAIGAVVLFLLDRGVIFASHEGGSEDLRDRAETGGNQHATANAAEQYNAANNTQRNPEPLA